MPTSSKIVLRELKRLGTAQNVKIYRRHGAGTSSKTPHAAAYIVRALARESA